MAEVIAQTALGLYDAHHARTPTGQALEIVHRDVSPQNVLICVDGRARLTDFGVARALERVSRTSTGEVKGKLSYFSPEQAKMEPLDQRSDLFALGVVAWEMLTLERLFSRESPMAALQAVLYERIPDVRELNPDVPEKLALAVAHALERNLDRRCPTGRVFADELRAAVSAPATPSEIGLWIEEAGGPRLAKFKGRIEQAFGQARASEAQAAAERASRTSLVPGSGSGSGSQQVLFHQPTPGSQVVGELGTVPEPLQVEHTPTRIGAPGASETGPLVIEPVTGVRAAAQVVPPLAVDVPVAHVPAEPASTPVASRTSSYVVAAGVAVGLVAAGVVSAVVFRAPAEPAPVEAPSRSVSATLHAPATPTPTTPEPLVIPMGAPIPTTALEPAPSSDPTRVGGGARGGAGVHAGSPQRDPEPPRVAPVAARVDPAPARSEPARSEPAHVEPAHVEPAQVEPQRVEPQRARVEPEAARVEPEAARAEPARTEPARAEAGRAEPGTETPSTEPVAPGGRLRVGTGAGRLRGSTP
jgi:serine/threonine-protein kinase